MKQKQYLPNKNNSSTFTFCIFFVNILHSLVLLSKFFQNKFVYVTKIGSIVRIEIAQIKMFFNYGTN